MPLKNDPKSIFSFHKLIISKIFKYKSVVNYYTEVKKEGEKEWSEWFINKLS
jgi:hypothetical protein